MNRLLKGILYLIAVVGTLLNIPLALSGQGVWKGEIGSARVIVCFDGSKYGSYYYEKYNTPIILLRNSDKNWEEKSPGKGKSTGSWALDENGGNRITGIWSRQNGESKPIRLHKIGEVIDLSRHLNNEKPCTSEEYFQLIDEFTESRGYGVEGPKFFNEDRTKKFEALWRKKGHESVETIRIDTGDSVIQRVNELMDKDLPVDNDIQTFFETTFNFRGELTKKTGPSIFAAPIYWNSTFFVVRYHVLRDYNPHLEGRRRPSFVEEYVHRTFDLRSGKEISIWSWFGQNNSKPCGSVLKANCGFGIPSARLLSLIAKHLKRDSSDECGTNLENGNLKYQAIISDSGILFSIYRFSKDQRCIFQADVPFLELMPMLNKIGVESVRNIKSSGSAGTKGSAESGALRGYHLN